MWWGGEGLWVVVSGKVRLHCFSFYPQLRSSEHYTHHLTLMFTQKGSYHLQVLCHLPREVPPEEEEVLGVGAWQDALGLSPNIPDEHDLENVLELSQAAAGFINQIGSSSRNKR